MDVDKILNKKEAKLAFEKGVEFLNKKDFKNAEVQFLESLTLVPNRTSVIYNLIQIYYRLKDARKLEILVNLCKDIKNTKEVKLATAYKEYFNKNYRESIRIAEGLDRKSTRLNSSH